jgi:hypothetical protein
MSEAIPPQQHHTDEFFKKLDDNLADDNPSNQPQLVYEFRALILEHTAQTARANRP